MIVVNAFLKRMPMVDLQTTVKAKIFSFDF